MFAQICAQLAQQALTERELAQQLGIGYETLLQKLGGNGPLRWTKR